MNAPRTTATTTLGCTVDPDEVRNTQTDARQTQVYVNDGVKLHLTGNPAHWRMLAKAIEDAAMEAEGLSRWVDDQEARTEIHVSTVRDIDPLNLPGLAER